MLTPKMHNDKTLHVMFDLYLVFTVTSIIENFHIWNFRRWHKMSSLGWKIFIMTEDTSIEKLPNTH